MAERSCRLCGCTDLNACHDDHRGCCSWVGDDLCFHCADTTKYLMRRLEGTIPLALAVDGVEHIAIATHHAEQFQRMVSHLGGDDLIRFIHARPLPAGELHG